MKRLFVVVFRLFGAVIMLQSSMAVAVQPQVGGANAVESLVDADRRLATLALPLLVGNAALCRQQSPIPGLVLHSRDQYSSNIERRFPGGASLAISAVVPSGPAMVAGLQDGDVVKRIGLSREPDWMAAGFTPLRDGAYASLFGISGPVIIGYERDGQSMSATIDAPTGCRSLVEVTTEDALAARADGRVIQLSYPLMVRASDEQVAVILAHELAHQVLEHRRRLDAAGVRKGFFGQFGGDFRINSQVEREADRLSVHLLANAGYDPAIAPDFWTSDLGREIASGVFRNRIYPSATERGALLDREIQRYLRGGAPSWPGHILASRDVPFAR